RIFGCHFSSLPDQQLFCLCDSLTCVFSIAVCTNLVRPCLGCRCTAYHDFYFVPEPFFLEKLDYVLLSLEGCGHKGGESNHISIDFLCLLDKIPDWNITSDIVHLKTSRLEHCGHN